MLALGVLSIAVFNLIGLIQVFSSWDFLKSLLSFSPTWLGAVRLFWGLTGMVIVWGLWVGRPWAPCVTRLATLLFAIYFWSDRLFLINPAGRGANYPFLIVITVMMLGAVFLVLAGPDSKKYFGVTDE